LVTMAAMDQSPVSASLAIVQAVGALPLEFAASHEEQVPQAQVPTPASPDASPYAGSTYTCGSPYGSPWSPATPAVQASTGMNAFGMPPSGPSPGLTQMILQSAQPIKPGALPGVRAVVVANSPPPSPGVRRVVVGVSSPIVVKRSPVQGSPAVFARVAPASPATFGSMALSPGAEIRKNAANFGIPLNLRTTKTEVSAPVPIRSAVGGVLAPSPTARVNNLPATTAASPFGFAPVPMLPGGQQPLFTRPIATPLTGSLPRRAAGGA